MEPGANFGSYRLLELLGEGGMGQVWKALDLRLERVVALKVLKELDEASRRGLIAEAKTASQLTHPNIAVVFDAGEVAGAPFIAMEFVEGRTLVEQTGRRWDESDLRNLAVQAAEALDHAHQKGIVHRDIKPANLVLTAEGRLEVLDFGVSKRTVPISAGGSEVTRMEETNPGFSAGTPSYMSPEQVRGEAVGPASDQFSLGVVLRELATGNHPFRQAGLVETLHAILKNELEPLSNLRPDLDPQLASALDRLLEKNPVHRFPGLRSFGLLLGGFSGQGPGAIVLPDAVTLRKVSAKTPVLRSRKPFVKWALSGAALALLGTGGWAAWRFKDGLHPAPPSDKTVVAVLPLESMGVNADQSWLGTSLVDAMATGLLRRGDLVVLDRLWVADAMVRLGDEPGQPPKNIQKLLKELKSDILVLGRYQVSGDQVRVSVRLMDGTRGQVKDQYSTEGTTGGLLKLEDDLQDHLPGMMGLRPAGTALNAHSRAKDPHTRELYARALDLSAKGNRAAFDAARELYLEAARQEPDYAPVHAGLAHALQGIAASQGHLGNVVQSHAHFLEAEKEARQAIRLDPGLSFAHRELAGALNFQGRYAEAKEAASHAVALDPADYLAYVTLGDAWAYEEGAEAHAIARRHYRRSIELAPDYWIPLFRSAVLMQNDGDLEESIRQADAASALQPSAEYTYLTAGVSLLWLGRPGEARARLEQGLQQVPSSRLLKVTLALAARDLQDQKLFQRSIVGLRGAWPSGHVISCLLEGLGKEMAGDRKAARSLFMGYLGKVQSPGYALPPWERRSASVNLYHMGRVLAQAGDRSAAQQLLEEADRLNHGKKAVAGRDPAFR
ncbi:MAG: protein kinase [Holophagaceae bacterium]|nr:protein kinase [Holophagaceae bacterium]